MQLRTGQVAVITGAASGIGAAVAQACATRGMAVGLADVEAAALEDTAEGLRRTMSVHARQVDVRAPEALDRFREEVLDRLGRVDLVVANAGVVGPRAPAWEQRASDWRWILDVNLMGIVNTVASFAPHLVSQGTGHLVITSSVAALTPMQGGGNAPYGASKAAVATFAEVLREDLAAEAPGVGLTVVFPGPVRTRIRDAARNRPPEFGGPTVADAPAFEHPQPPITAADAAEQILAAVARDASTILTNAEYLPQVNAQVLRLLDELGRQR